MGLSITATAEDSRSSRRSLDCLAPVATRASFAATVARWIVAAADTRASARFINRKISTNSDFSSDSDTLYPTFRVEKPERVCCWHSLIESEFGIMSEDENGADDNIADELLRQREWQEHTENLMEGSVGAGSTINNYYIPVHRIEAVLSIGLALMSILHFFGADIIQAIGGGMAIPLAADALLSYWNRQSE